MARKPKTPAAPVQGDDVVLTEKPDGYTSRHYALTVGKVYRCLGFDGSNIVTTTDEPGARASYSRTRVRRAAEEASYGR